MLLTIVFSILLMLLTIVFSILLMLLTIVFSILLMLLTIVFILSNNNYKFFPIIIINSFPPLIDDIINIIIIQLLYCNIIYGY